MKIKPSTSMRRTLCFYLINAFVTLGAFGQGSDNPSGVYGSFNAHSTTGGSYDPYTANATRTIPDITVAGAVGAYPLQWSRTMNSRSGAGWRHSYAWSCTTDSGSTNVPNYYTVFYPDGRVIKFTTGGSVGTPYKGPFGIRDRFQAAQGTNVDCYLLLADGGKVHFRQTAALSEGVWDFTITGPSEIIDPNGLRTTLTYDATTARLSQITEPAGRWLKIYYRSDTGYVGLIDHVDAGYGSGSGTLTQNVYYTWSPYGVYKVLTAASYSDNTASYPDIATYAYQPSNVTGSTAPLISICRDTRYPGPMKNISYDFVPGGSSGQLLRENYIDSNNYTTPVVTLTVNSATLRTETRGDGATRTFTYGAYAGSYYRGYFLLKSTDFLAKATTYAYDANGYVSSVTDAKGRKTSYTRLPATGALTKIDLPSDATTAAASIQYSYEDPTAGYYLKTVTDALGRITTYKHGNLTTMNISEIDYPDGGIERFTYNGYNQVLTHTMVSNANGTTGGIESFAYDTGGRGLLTKSTPPAGTNGPTLYSYNVNDHLSTVTDPRGNVTTLYHDQVGRLTFIQHPGSHQIFDAFVYNPDGTLKQTSIQQAVGVSADTTYTYDDYKRVKTIVRPLRYTSDTSARTTKVFYDATGTGNDYTHTDANPTFLTTPAGVDVVNEYDKNFRLLSRTLGDTARTDSTPSKTSYTYDAVGNLLTMTGPNGQPGAGFPGTKFTYTYDARNRLLTVDDPTGLNKNSLGHTVNYTYDVAGNKKSEKRANDQTITYDTYDAMNRLTKMTVPQGVTPSAVTSYTWTRAGKLDIMTDPRLKVYNYDYDVLNRLIKTTYPADSGNVVRTEGRTYDLAGNLATFKNRAGNTQTFFYDTRNRETRYDWNDGVTLARTLSYDDASNILTCNNGNQYVTRTYFADGLLASEYVHNYNYADYTGTINYTYDADGRRATTKYPSGSTFSSGYTARGELRTLYDITGNPPAPPYEAYYIYDVAGNLTSRRVDANLTRSALTFADSLNRLTQTQHFFTTGGSPTFNYGYDEMSNRLYEKRDGTLADWFGYDANNELTSFRRDGNLSGSGGTLNSLVYDASGNRTSLAMTVGTSTTTTTYAAANNLNQYPTVGGLGATYDGNGNLKTYNGWSYTYDAMNRLTAAVKGTASANFWYDGFNRICTWQQNGATNARFNVYDGWDLVAEYKAGNVLDTEYLHGAGSDELVSMTRGGQTYYFFQDGRGNTSQIADDNGALVETTKYDVYGKPTTTVAAGKVATGNRFLFTGREYFSSIGLYNYRNRFYAPDWGRFLQPDPIGFGGDSANLYRYVGNNPVNWSDPLGLAPKKSLDNPGGWPEVPEIHVTATYLPNPLDNPSVRLGPTGDPGGGGGRGSAGNGETGGAGQSGSKNVSMKKDDDCHQLASQVQDIADRTNSDQQFLDTLARTFTSAENSSTLEMFRHSGGNPPQSFTDSGFRQQFRDGSNQVRHFAGAFIAGANGYGGLFNVREYLPFSHGGDQDLALNSAAFTLAGAFTSQPTSAAERRDLLAKSILIIICE